MLSNTVYGTVYGKWHDIYLAADITNNPTQVFASKLFIHHSRTL